MNKALLDPFIISQEYPRSLAYTHNLGDITCFNFSPTGDYAAAGLESGLIIVVDTVAWAPVCKLQGHSSSVDSVEWSKDSKYLVSASRDFHIIYWDLMEHKIVSEQMSGSSSSFAAVGDQEYIAARYEGSPFYYNVKLELRIEIVQVEKCHACHFFDNGQFLLGDSQGYLRLFKFNAESRQVDEVYAEKVVSGAITGFYVKLSKLVLTATRDKTIRVFDMELSDNPKFKPLIRIQDPVNKFKWANVVCSPSAEYILAVPQESSHNIHMWNLAQGTLENIYRCPEEILTLDFHPTKAILIASGVDTHTVYVWVSKFKQTWGALAPGFVELAHNEVYDEPEDEFDILTEEPDKLEIWPLDKKVDIYTSEIADVPILPIQ